MQNAISQFISQYDVDNDDCRRRHLLFFCFSLSACCRFNKIIVVLYIYFCSMMTDSRPTFSTKRCAMDAGQSSGFHSGIVAVGQHFA